MPKSIDDLIAEKRSELNTKINLHNDYATELETLREAATPDEAKVTEIRERKATAGSAIETLRSQLTELETEKRVDDTVASLQRETTPTDVALREEVSYRVVSEPNPVYRKGDMGTSYFRDLFDVTRGSTEARDRLAQSQARAATTVAGAGGEFAPPAWLVEDFVAIARAGRVTADLMNKQTLPGGISSVNLPKGLTNSVAAVTQTQNTTITESAFTSTSVTSGISEISAKQTISLALIKQSGVPIDQVILTDLAQGYAVTLDGQVLNGSNAAGQLRGLLTAGTTVTYTSAAPAVVSTTAANSFYNKILSAQAAMNGTRFLPANAIVMHPRRWSWVLSALDSSNRPLVTPNGNAFNQVAVAGVNVAEGFAGELLGLPVYVDPNIVTNRGVATNQDVVYVLRTDDLWLWETDVETASFDATLADQNSILFRVLGYSAFIPDRYAASVQVIDGTGLVAPSF